jgi:hypothetical protein
MKKTTNSIIAFSIVIMTMMSLPVTTLAQERLSITLTPPLFRLTLSPGESWPSSVKLVNVNDYDLTVYATTKDFTDSNGKGNPEFLPPSDDPNNTHSLGSWISVPKGPLVIPRGSTKDIPFSIHVPQGAEPGGHYGAIQVGTVPVGEKGESGVAVGSQVATLFFIRVSGSVTEAAAIRDFYSASSFVGSATQNFVLAVENTGNVHVQPQGEILIKNMWGKVRGTIAINKETNFGNVLPSSSRTFEFVWDGEENLFDIGLYSAEVSISYGEEAKQSLYRKTSFWVIPWKPVSTLVGGLFALIFLVVWSMKRYIRQALDLERRRQGLASVSALPKNSTNMRVIGAPIGKSVSDLRRVGERSMNDRGESPLGIGEYLWRYRFIFFVLIAFLALGCGVYVYMTSVLTPTRDFKAEIKKQTGETSIIAPK